MPTVAEAVAEAITHLGGDGSPRGSIDGAHNNAVTSILMDVDPGVAAGDVIEIESTAEQMFVWSVSTLTLTVERGFGTSTAAAIADGAAFRLSPVVARSDVLREMGNEVRSLSSAGLFTVSSTAVTFDYNACHYDASAITDVRSWFAIQFTYGGEDFERYDFHELQDGLIVPHFYPPLAAATMAYRGKLTVPTALADDLVTDVGLTDSAVDIPALGVAARLWDQVAAKRTQVRAHSSHRRPEDVTPIDPIRLGSRFRNERDRRVGEELFELRRQMPVRQG